MAKISTYQLDASIDPADKVIGTDGAEGAENATKNYSVAALGAYINALGVETVSTVDSTFINLTPNSQTIGDVIVTADLSAVGTPDNTKFLRGDNSWAQIDVGVTTVASTDGTFIDISSPQQPTSGAVTIIADLSATGTPSSSTFLRGDNTWAVAGGITINTLSGVISTDHTTINTLSGDLTLAQGTGISVTDNGSDTITVSNTFTDSPLELIDEGNGDGIVLAGRTASNYGNVGNKAVDISHSNQSSTTYGATAEYSFASGSSATASGLYSVSFSGTATGVNSLALGRQSSATSANAVALGSLSSATGISDLAIGAGATASGSGAIAVGSADSTATYTIAIGQTSAASSNFAVAIGHQADATATYAMGLGYNASATGIQSAAIGKDSSATHTAATALGSGAATTADYQIALGSASASVAVLIASLPNTPSYADDTAAAAGGVQIGELYRDGSVVNDSEAKKFIYNGYKKNICWSRL